MLKIAIIVPKYMKAAFERCPKKHPINKNIVRYNFFFCMADTDVVNSLTGRVKASTSKKEPIMPDSNNTRTT